MDEGRGKGGGEKKREEGEDGYSMGKGVGGGWMKVGEKGAGEGVGRWGKDR